MEQTKYDALISQLEGTAERSPKKYIAFVLLVASFGFAILGIAIGFSLLAVALLIGIVLLAIFTGGKALILLAKLGKLIVVLAIPAWTMVKSSFTMLFSRFPRPEGKEIFRNDAPALFSRLDDLQRRMAGPRIHKVLLTDELNAAIVQHPRLGLFGWEQNYLILGFPLLQTLSEEEALAVVAHEYGHLSGHHSRLGGFIYRFRAAWGRIQNLAEGWDDWGSRLMARLLKWYAPYFNAYTFVLARQQEYLADRASVEIAGQRSAANALMRINIVGSFEDEIFWPAVDRRVVHEPEPIASRTGFWVESIQRNLDQAACVRFLDLAIQRMTDHLDTHPSLNDRLSAMGVSAGGEGLSPFESPASSAAEEWLGPRLAEIQGEFDAAWRDKIAEKWRSRHVYLKERFERLVQLEAQAALDVAEQWERLSLIDELKPELDLLPLINSLLEQAPDHLSALYRRGTLLLARGDEAGIADLETVMSRDPEAILAGCEEGWRFYSSRDQAKAGVYLKRWQERSDYLGRLDAELETLPADAELAPADLDDQIVEAIRQIVRRQGKQIRRAYLLRRILKIDANVKDYVLAFETSPFTLGNKGPAIIKNLVKEEFPLRMFVVHLGSEPYKRFRKSIKRMKLEPFLRS